MRTGRGVIAAGRAVAMGVLVLIGVVSCDTPPPQTKPASTLVYVALGAAGSDYVVRIRDALQGPTRTIDLIDLRAADGAIDAVNDALLPLLLAGRQPRLVTLWAGADDLLAGRDVVDFESGLSVALERLHNNTTALVVVGTMPDGIGIPGTIRTQPESLTPQRVRAFNEAVTRQASLHGAVLVDLSGVTIAAKLVTTTDGAHLSAEGGDVVAAQFLAAIQPRLPAPPKPLK
ncbi:MAG: hypothetical protein HQL37_07985 [Alphaproteobacteria bacterium]|nr:hypothetical protein [Alphaproteobacteria bacterium]